ncbi:methyl-CpG-binding domain protein 1b isoform X2 [Dunckerocampus dactyliophorus]|uniref:methyl-CpG-binding domain protein 1b isoform X2 n=1 Tax=Dunckerocampus dactyliophorus TaxID=161453 RepID=UPI0024076767|nr:methyl-CpG-binding domain protein 1b isoform X2 [Dunckerocampus dactyliophorus]
MEEESLPATGSNPVEKDVEQSADKTGEAEEMAQKQDTAEKPASDPVGETLGEVENPTKDEEKDHVGSPPIDWLEPLEDDEQSDGDQESMAGESEKSHSFGGSENALKLVAKRAANRRNGGLARKRSRPEEGWVDVPDLGAGWKRKEVIRRSGCSVGQKDVYYLSPDGDRVRSKVELMALLVGVDMSNFDFKAGKFYNGQGQKPRGRGKKKMQERYYTEPSWMNTGEGADTQDPPYTLTPNHWPKNSHSDQTAVSEQSTVGKSYQNAGSDNVVPSIKIKIHRPSSSRPLPSINGEIATEENQLKCWRCGVLFTGTWYDRQRKRPFCPTCWASKANEHPMVRFRKGSESEDFLPQKMSQSDISELLDDSMSFQREVPDLQHQSLDQSLKSSDTENFSAIMDFDDDDDLSTDDDDDWHKKRKRRACGKCNACLCRKDCGTCDFCVDKPKFGGRNKKRQKCRLRQCQRQAMRHLLPFQMSYADCKSADPSLPGRPRPHYTYSRKTNLKNKKTTFPLEFSDDDLPDMSWSSEPSGSSKYLDINPKPDSSKQLVRSNLEDQVRMARQDIDRSNHKSSHQEVLNEWDEDDPRIDTQVPIQIEEDDELPMITQIFSLADNPVVGTEELDDHLKKLLVSLRDTTLPILWYAIMAEGPQLQLIQCAKQSSMSDTVVLIDPGFFFQVTVQNQPLSPAHPLYDDYPPKLTTVTEVVTLLLGLENYVLCKGLPPKQLLSSHGPITLERASTCDFLVERHVDICSHCRLLRG